eukprot:gene12595-biopygen22988
MNSVPPASANTHPAGVRGSSEARQHRPGGRCKSVFSGGSTVFSVATAQSGGPGISTVWSGHFNGPNQRSLRQPDVQRPTA